MSTQSPYAPVDEENDLPGVGGLKLLTLQQMMDLSHELFTELLLRATCKVSEESKAKISTSLAIHLSDLPPLAQGIAITNSTYLSTKAAAMMLGNRQWTDSPLLAAQKLDQSHLPKIHRRILESFGFDLDTTLRKRPEDVAAKELAERLATDAVIERLAAAVAKKLEEPRIIILKDDEPTSPAPTPEAPAVEPEPAAP